MKDHGAGLLANKHFAATEIKGMCEQLDTVWNSLNVTWEDRKQLLTQCYDLQVYEEYAEQADSWLMSKEAFLANEDVGVSSIIFCIVDHFLDKLVAFAFHLFDRAMKMFLN